MRMRPFTVIAISVTAAATMSCTPAVPPSFGEPHPMHLPSGTNAMGARLSSGPGGPVLVSWMQREDTGATLRFSRYEVGEWRNPQIVVTDPEMFVNWADLPSVTPLRDGHWVAHWLSKSGTETYAYDVLVTQSSDEGQSWGEPLRPHTDATPTEHGFVSILPLNDSSLLLWLDGRNTAAQPASEPLQSSMTLRSAIVTPQGAISGEQLVDGSVCDCCQTDAAVSSAGPIAVYRDRTPGEIRDVYVTRFADGRWSPGSPIREDGWVIRGCPVNGPAIDAAGDLVGVAWFSAADGRAVVRAAISTNAGKTFKDPVDIASAGASGHVGIAVIDRKSVAVSWVETDKHGTNAINIRGLTRSGDLGPVNTVGRSTLKRIYPQLIRSDDRLILAWTDQITDATEIVSVVVPILGFYEH